MSRSFKLRWVALVLPVVIGVVVVCSIGNRSQSVVARPVKTIGEIGGNVAFLKNDTRVHEGQSGEWYEAAFGEKPISIDWHSASQAGISHVRSPKEKDAFYLVTKNPKPQISLIMQGEGMCNPIWLATSEDGKPSELLFEKWDSSREQYAVWRYSLQTRHSRMLTYGDQVKLSPDASRILFLRSKQSMGDYEIKVARLNGESDEHCLLEITETDPGSGPSFDFHWSADSNYILVTGKASRTSVANGLNKWSINLVCDLRSGAYYKVEEALSLAAD